jgi:UDP-4-amino-4,6-dideoxy-N-acetyl-beta-L-altrosamine N-acetyltransferase
MIISGYGIELIRLKEEDIELVRQHRNSEHIQQFMEYRKFITAEMQKKWFQSVNNIHNNYFIIQINGEKIGLINGAQIDWDKKETGSGGVFIWKTEYWETKAPLAASLLLTDTSVLLGMKKTYAKILQDNKKAIAFNKALGYELMEGQEAFYNQHYVLTMTQYINKRDRLRKKIFSKQTYQKIQLIIEQESELDAVVQFMLEKINKLPEEQKKGFEIFGT